MIKKFLAMSIILIYSINSNAEEHFLYRVDTRSPSYIFTFGFISLGDNRSVLQHVRGTSCRGTGDTMYISATGDYYWARNYAYRLSGNLAQDPFAIDANVYIYRIRHTPAFYETSRVLTRLSQGSTSSSITRQARNAISTARDQAEWIIEGSISPLDINSAVQIHYRQLTEGSDQPRILLNPSYSNDTNRGGVSYADSVPQSNEDPTVSAFYLRLAPRNIINTCFSGLLWCAHTKNNDDRFLSKGEPTYCPSENISMINSPPLSSDINRTLFIRD